MLKINADDRLLALCPPGRKYPPGHQQNEGEEDEADQKRGSHLPEHGGRDRGTKKSFGFTEG
jgi:hypothetical protein